MQREVWKDVPHYNGFYQVSNLGRVKSLKSGKEKIMKTHKDKNGYIKVGLTKWLKCKLFYVHQLVAICFLDFIPHRLKYIDNPKKRIEYLRKKPNPNEYVVDHINFIRDDNRIENLRVITNQENLKHRKSNSL